MTLLELMESRHSYRGEYENTPVPREDLRKIMQAGLAAPSGCNKQTVSLIAVDDPVILQKLYQVVKPPRLCNSTGDHLRSDPPNRILSW